MYCKKSVCFDAVGGRAMSTRLWECLNGKQGTEYILPFFWQHGESHDILEKEMDAIRASGITEMCVESRPHEEFGREKWWDDFGFILRYAQHHDMKVWLLDDKHFPTGYANGYVEQHPELAQLTLTMVCFDVLSGGGRMNLLPPALDEGESFAAVVALPRVEASGESPRMGDMPVLLDTETVNGFLPAELPQGLWRIYYLIRSQKRHHRKQYIDMLNPESTKAMLYAVYEPHYEHFGEYFGNTFKGFFSDEPCFGNDNVLHFGHLGNMKTIPWRDDLPELMAAKNGMTPQEICSLLPALFQDVTGRMASVRHAYMDTVTELYSRNFSWLLGDWCRERGVMYIGHIIEDSGAHLALGCSCGHFFRGLEGQDMAGIDIVLHEITPGILENIHTACLSVGVADPALYHYLLGKLASSHAHIDAKKKGRAMCEVFGAFGWAEGLPMMKKLADHFLSCGINYFVPHAFSPMYDDPDCPPYFYNHGKNTQFVHFAGLMRYMQRVSHILSEGIHKADVAVLYNTGKWTGLANMPTEKVTKALTQAQIDFDIIPEDYLLGACSVQNARLCCGAESYAAMIVPYCRMLPLAVRRQLDAFACAGLPVYFVDGAPEFVPETGETFAPSAADTVVKLRSLVAVLRKKGFAHITLSKRHPHVRYYHMERSDGDAIMFLNEDEHTSADFTVRYDGDAVLYDAYENRVWRPQRKNGKVRIRLEPGCSILLIGGNDLPAAPVYQYGDEGGWRPVEARYAVSCRCHDESEYRSVGTADVPQPISLTLAPQVERVRYEFTMPAVTAEHTLLDLGRVGEVSELWLNGEYLGAKIGSPYRYDLSGRLTREENHLTVDVIINQVYAHPDGFSSFIPVALPGIDGVITVCSYGESEYKPEAR